VIKVRFTGGLDGPAGGHRMSDGLWFTDDREGGSLYESSIFYPFAEKAALDEGPHRTDDGDPPSTERLPGSEP
jgi:hypothetical protein